MRIVDERSATWAAGFCSAATASLSSAVPAATAPVVVKTSRRDGMGFSFLTNKLMLKRLFFITAH